MKQKKGFELRDVCGEKAIVPEGIETIDFSKLISLNHTAAWLWKKAGELGDFTADQLAEALCSEYDVDSDRAKADVKVLLDKWLHIGLIE